MDLNLAELKKITNETGNEYVEDLLGGIKWSETENRSSIGQQDYDFEHIDPFAQRMSDDAKEAQEQLETNFSDFLGQTIQNMKQGLAGTTQDFLNTEKAFLGEIGDLRKKDYSKVTEKSKDKDNDIFGGHSGYSSHSGNGDGNFRLFENSYKNILLDDILSSSVKTPVPKKDSDTDSPSISYNPSPAKKLPVTNALKDQDNEKFISSEDLLGDFEERNLKIIAPLKKQHVDATPVIDLNTDGDEFIQGEILKDSENFVQSKINITIMKPLPVVKEPIETKPSVMKAKTTSVTVQTASILQQPQIISVEDIFKKYNLDAWFKPDRLHPQVESLIYWRDVRKSGVVFGAGLVALLAISCFSVISVFAYISLMVLSGTIVFRIYKSVMQAIQKTSDGHPFKEYLEYDLALSQEKMRHIADVAVAHLNGFISEMRRLFLVEDLVDSIKFGVILCVMTYIGAWFNGMTLVLMAFVSLFTLPKVYENNKQSIDTYLDLARSKVAEVTEKIKAAIPLGTKKPLAAESDKEK